jgi:glucose-6-phosphate 1-epimerase
MSAPQLSQFLGQPALTLRAPDGARATVLLHGGQLVSWIPSGGEEQLYLSPNSRYGTGASVRGGVPVIFPQFSEQGPLPRHGLVRTRSWEAVEDVVRGRHAIGVLRFGSDLATRVHWKHDFALELTVSLAGRELDIELAVTNTGQTPFEFQAALHTYLRCNDAMRAQVEGLQDCRYTDMLLGEGGQGLPGQQWGDVLTVVGALDRVYQQPKGSLTLRELGRKLSVVLREFDDVVVWNPGPEGAAALADLPDEDWQHMMCIEAAQITNPVRLAPGSEWAGMQCLMAV